MATDRYGRQTFKNLLNGVGGMIGQSATTLISSSQTTTSSTLGGLMVNGVVIGSSDENTHMLMNNKMALKASSLSGNVNSMMMLNGTNNGNGLVGGGGGGVGGCNPSSNNTLQQSSSSSSSCVVNQMNAAAISMQQQLAAAVNSMLGSNAAISGINGAAGGVGGGGGQRNALGDIGNRILPNSNINNLQQQIPTQLGVGGGGGGVNVKKDMDMFAKPAQISQTTTTTTSSSSLTTTNTSTTTIMNSKQPQQASMPITFGLKSEQQTAGAAAAVGGGVLADESNISMEEDVIDIDQFDGENTQLCTEYVKEIYLYLNQLEKRYRISSTFLDRKIISSKMRSVLIDWLIQVHLKFHLLQETLYLCVYIIDSFLEAEDVSKMQLQLVGVTAMFLASKYEEMYVPAIDDFVYMTDNTYSKSEIRQMEIRIIKRLNFMFCKPTPLHFLRRFSKAGQSDPKQHTLAKFFMELSLHDAEFSSFDPSYLAASSLCLAFKLLGETKWDRTLEYYSLYKEKSLLPGMHKIAKLVLKSLDPDYKYKGVINKYGASKFLRISILPELSGDYMKELASSSSFNQ